MKNTDRAEIEQLEIISNARKTVTMLRFLLISIVALGYIYYGTIESIDRNIVFNKQQMINNAKSIEQLQSNFKIFAASNTLYEGNLKAFNSSVNATKCKKCHLKPTMYLLKSNMNLIKFIDYVREHKANGGMPNFSNQLISDDELENMYMILKYTMNEIR